MAGREKKVSKKKVNNNSKLEVAIVYVQQSREPEEVECGTVNLSRYQSVPDLIFRSCQQPSISTATRHTMQ